MYPDTLLEPFPPTPADTLASSGGLDGPEAGESARCWWVLCTKARQEKSLARDLRRWEIPFYLPQVRKTLTYGRQMVRSCVPLFTGYVFVYGTWDERVASLSTNRVTQTLAVDDDAGLVGDLRQIRRLIEADAPLTLESRLAAGRRVRVRRGPLAGLEGLVMERRARTRLLVRVDFLQQGASVEIDDYLLEAID